MCKVPTSAAALERALAECELEHGGPMVCIDLRRKNTTREDGSKVIEVWAKFTRKKTS